MVIPCGCTNTLTPPLQNLCSRREERLPMSSFTFLISVQLKFRNLSCLSSHNDNGDDFIRVPLDPTPAEKWGWVEMLLEFLSVAVFPGKESPSFDISIPLRGEKPNITTQTYNLLHSWIPMSANCWNICPSLNTHFFTEFSPTYISM